MNLIGHTYSNSGLRPLPWPLPDRSGVHRHGPPGPLGRQPVGAHPETVQNEQHPSDRVGTPTVTIP